MGATRDGRPVFRKRVSRAQFLGFLAKQSPAVVAMEACATAHGWGRAISGLGHEVRLIPPIYVKPFVRRQKNDAQLNAERKANSADIRDPISGTPAIPQVDADDGLAIPAHLDRRQPSP
jgi:transposase